MATIKLKHVERFKDRYENIRYYFRIGKGPRFPLAGDPGSDEFNASYARAVGKSKTPTYSQDRTFNALAKKYYASPKFLKWKESSKAVTRGIVDKFCVEHGHRLVRQMTATDIDMLIGQKAATPAAANNLLKKLRVLIKFAIKLEWIDRDPTVSAEQFKGGSHHSWTEAEIAKFEKRWPLGSRERIAFDLHLYTGQRRGDVCAMDPQEDVEWRIIEIDGKPIRKMFIRVVQEKTGTALVIPAHENLVHSFNLWHGVGQTIIAQATGKRYTVESYGNLMADAIQEAKLSARCVLHGLKKAAGRRLAEAGCTVHQIQAILGNLSLEEIERYTKAANQGWLAIQAIDSLGKFKKA